MIGLFVLGSLATVSGILLAWYLLAPEQILGDNAKTIAGMLTGTYTGGSVNFNAIALEYNFQEQGILYAGTIAVDNVVTTLWIIVTLALPRMMRPFWKDNKSPSTNRSKAADTPMDSLDMYSLARLLVLGLGALFVSEWVSELIPAVPSIITLTTIGILLAQTPFVSRLGGAHTLGLYLVYIFLAVIGAYCEVGAVVDLKSIGLSLLLFTSVAVLVHGVLMVLLGGLLYRDWSMIAIVSQANVGGSTTALALAETFERKELVLPAILVGTLGNALGTYLGFLVIQLL